MRSISVGVVLTPNTKTTLFTVPVRYSGKWNLLYAHNGTSSAKKFDAWWYDASQDVEIPIVYQYPLDTAEYLKFDGGAYVVLEEGDEIRVKIETGATNASAICTIELENKTSLQFGP